MAVLWWLLLCVLIVKLLHDLELLALARTWAGATSTAFFSHLELNRNLFSFFQSTLTVITSASTLNWHLIWSASICSIFGNLEVKGVKIG